MLVMGQEEVEVLGNKQRLLIKVNLHQLGVKERHDGQLWLHHVLYVPVLAPLVLLPGLIAPLLDQILLDLL